MRVHHVTITGFGPFRGTERVDFDSFGGDGIFLITGRTGAGKTSILDAVSYALFGAVPRYEGGAEVSVRSNFLGPDQPCQVCLEFTVADTRYRITRSTSYQRAKSRGEGTTLVKPAAQLEELGCGEWQVLETQIRDVQRRLDDIVRLNADQFRQVVLLAQGQFQEFLVASCDNRGKLLRRLFGTERFLGYRELLDRRARELAEQQREQRATVLLRVGELARLATQEAPTIEPGEELLAWVEGVVAEQDQVVVEASSRKTALALQLASARALHDEAKVIAERQERRRREIEKQERLQGAVASINGERLRIEAARRAEVAAQAVAGWQEAVVALTREAEKNRAAESAFLAVWPSLPDDPAEVSRTVEDLGHQVGSLRDHLEDERALVHLESTVATSGAELAALDERVLEAEAQRVTLRVRAGALEERAECLRGQAGRLPMAELREKEAAERCRAARRAEQLAAELGEARVEALGAGRRLSESSQARDDLRVRQLAGYAGVLGGELVPGEPCAVCGSPEHPNPARLGDDHVGEADLAAAEAAVAAAIDASRAADSSVTGLEERVAAERARCGELSVDAAGAQRTLVAEEVTGLRTLAREAEAATAEQHELVSSLEQLSATIEQAKVARGELLTVATAAGQRLAEVTRAVQAARAGFPSVAARLADVESRCSIGQRLIAAHQAVSRAGDAESQQRGVMTEVLDRTRFATAEEALGACLAKAEIDARAAHVASHDAALAAVAMVLAAPELTDLPDEPVDLTGPTEAKQRIEAGLRDADEALAAARPVLNLMHDAADELGSTTRQYLAARSRHEVVARLAASVRGDAPNTMSMELEAFVLAAELEDIVQAANVRLRTMTSGRYELQHSDALARYRASSGLSLKVLDAHTGEARTPESLSGGEKFQASLALALGLAEVVTSRAGGMRLDTLFIDEGFGSLDADTLETTMATLDSLREGGRTVGLISHVEALRETVAAQLNVKVVAGGWSVIDQPGLESSATSPAGNTRRSHSQVHGSAGT